MKTTIILDAGRQATICQNQFGITSNDKAKNNLFFKHPPKGRAFGALGGGRVLRARASLFLPLTPPSPPRGEGASLGRSMIEMLGVLAIIGVLSAGGIMGYSVAMDNYRINKTIDDISQMAVRTGNFFIADNKVGGRGIEADKLAQIGIIAPELAKTLQPCTVAEAIGYCVMTPLKTLMFSRYNTGFTFGSFLEIRMVVKPDQCIKLVSYNWSGLAANFQILAYNGTPHHAWVRGTIDNRVLSVAEAKEYCGTNDWWVIRFHYRGKPQDYSATP